MKKNKYVVWLMLISNLMISNFVFSQSQPISQFFDQSAFAFYYFDTNNYILPRVNDQTQLLQILNSEFKLPTGSFYNSYQKATNFSNRIFLPGLHNQVPQYDSMFQESKVNFTIDTSTISTYSYFAKGVDSNVAFLIMPGSGDYQAFYIAEDNVDNYHNSYCIIKEYLKTKGDVYMYVKPNDCFRGIWNDTLYGNRLSYDVIDPYTKLNGKDWMDNLYTEYCSMVKFLKQKYKRVVLLGLSAGGWPPLFSSLQSKPDATIISSGFSALSYQNFVVNNNYNTILDGVLGHYPLDTLRQLIRNSNKEYLFTYGSNDSPSNVYEFQTQSLEDSLQIPSRLNNINFAYFMGFHTFPCYTIDTFLSRVLLKPKVNFETISTNYCSYDTICVKYKFIGKGPYTFDVFKDGQLWNHLSSSIDSINIKYFIEGAYQIRNILDSNNILGFDSDTFYLKKTPLVDLTISPNSYNCDSNTNSFDLRLFGKSPWNLIYNFNGVAQNKIINDSSSFLIFKNGNVNFISLTDSNTCFKNLNNTLNINTNLILNYFSTPTYNCDSNKTQLSINLQGNAPYTIYYTQDGISKTYSTSKSTTTLYLSNGIYNFIKVTDSTGCTKSINQIYTFQYSTLLASHTAPLYNCDSNKTSITFSSMGNAPFVYTYIENGINKTITTSNASQSLMLSNGTTQLQSVTDATGCLQTINENYSFNTTPINITLSNPTYNCDSNKTQLSINLQGNAPYTIYYTQDGISKTYSTSKSTTTLYLSNGIYNFIKVTDSTGCTKSINQIYTFQYSTLLASHTAPLYNCDSNKTGITFSSTGNAPFVYTYIENGINKTITTSNASQSLMLSNGTTQLQSVTDATGCLQTINENYSFNTTPINITLSNPTYNCDSNKTQLSINLQGNAPYTIYYTQDGISKTYSTSKSTTTLYLSNGIYNFIKVTDSTGCTKSINQIYTFQYSTLLASHTAPLYNCDSNKTGITFSSTGNAPFVYTYIENGINKTITTSNAIQSLMLSNGTTQLQSVSDATGCLQTINENYSFNTTPINITLSNPTYNCDSNKTQLSINLQGNAPYTIYYTQDGISKTYSTSKSTTTLYLSNGIYNFIKVTDSTGCTKSINQIYTFQYSTLLASHTAPLYNCDSNKTGITFSSMGNAPFVYTYVENGINKTITTTNATQTILFSNGTTQINNVTDATGCLQTINENYSFNTTPINITLSNPTYNCDSNKTQLSINLQGNAPYTIYYTQDGISKTYSTSKSTTTLYLSNGIYNFIKVTDSTGCTKSINQIYTFQYSTLLASHTAPLYNCDSNKTGITFSSMGNAPFVYTYIENGINKTITTTNATQTILFSNGTTQINNVTDATGCLQTINENYSFNTTPINITLSNPTYNCDSNKTQLSINLQGNAPYTIYYTQDGISKTYSTSKSTTTLYLSNGIYNFIKVTDSTGCTKSINQIYTFQYSTLLASHTAPLYNCDSNKTGITFSSTGNAPFLYTYIENGINKTIATSNAIQSLMLSNGTTQLQSVSDTTGCLQTINENYSFSYQKLALNINTPIYICNSNKTKVTFNVNGIPPFVLNYLQDGISNSYTSNNLTFDLIIPNGIYTFLNITDSLNCNLVINKNYIINNNKLNYSIINDPIYSCNLNTTNMQLKFDGNSKFTLNYLYNSIPQQIQTYANNYNFIMPNGNYLIVNLEDSNGCVMNINKSYNIQSQGLSAILSNGIYNCDSNKTVINFQLFGNSPRTISYYKNGIFNQFTTNKDSLDLMLENGNYYFTTCQSPPDCNFNINKSYLINFDTLGINIISNKYNCDSNKVQYNLGLTGNFPIQLKLLDINSNKYLTFNFYTNTGSIFLPSGNYQFISVTDSFCSKILNNYLNVDFPKLVTSISPISLMCDSAKYNIDINVISGKKPINLNYLKNGINTIYNLTSNTNKLFLDNANYYFGTITDTFGCINKYIINKNIQYLPFQNITITPKYNCKTDSTDINIQISPMGNYSLSYTNINDTSLILSENFSNFSLKNNSYTFYNVADSLNCNYSINKFLKIDNNPISAKLLSLDTLCESKNYKLNFQFSGNSPWVVDYNFENKLYHKIFYNEVDTMYLNNGKYNFIKISDSNICETPLSIKIDSLTEFLNLNPELSLEGSFLKATNSNCNYLWYFNNDFIEATNKNKILNNGDGLYYALLIDNTNCEHRTNTLNLKYSEIVNVFPNPSTTSFNILITDKKVTNWGYQIYDLLGNIVQSSLNNSAQLEEINTEGIAPAIYNLKITYTLNDNTFIVFKKITKLK